MRIERKTVHLPKNTSSRFFRKSILKGYKPIGSGAFATAYVKDKKTSRIVVKLGNIEYGSFKTDAYLCYLRNIVLKHQKNPLVPKIKNVTFYTVHTSLCYDDGFNKRTSKDVERFYVVKMERLRKFFSVKKKEREAAIAQLGLDHYYDLEYPLHTPCCDKTGHLSQIAKKLNALYSQHGRDIHSGNMMWRVRSGKKPQLVIIDPVA